MTTNHKIALIFELVYSFVPNCRGDGGEEGGERVKLQILEKKILQFI